MSLDLTPEQLRSNLSPKSLERISGKTVHPWIVGETGTSQPRDLSSGGRNQKLTWAKRAIQALKNAVKTGTKLFQNHGKGTNSHDERASIGEVVETFERTLPDGRTQAIAVGLLDGDYPDLDVCSIEAEVEWNQDGEVLDVPLVSAVALGSSKTDSPAFPGAQRLASLQFFGEDKEDDQKQETRTMTYAEIKAGVEELGLAPHRLFSADQIREDNRIMKDISSDFEKQMEPLTAERDKLAEENKTLAEKAEAGAAAIKTVAISTGRKSLESAIPEGTTDKQRKFLLDEFSPESEDDLTPEALTGYVEAGTKRFADLAKMFGGESARSGGGESDGDESGDSEPADELLKAITG